MHALRLIIFLCLAGIFGCTDPHPTKVFDTFLTEPAMIVNHEQDNTTEGRYLSVQSIRAWDTMAEIQLPLPADFHINHDNFHQWMIGWGSNVPLFDSGRENIRRILSIDLENGIIQTGGLLRGEGTPEEGQRVVFWNLKPSGFYNYHKEPVINPRLWPGFAGNQVHAGAIAFDSIAGKWIMILNESSLTKLESEVSIYAAQSDDLLHWEPANNGQPILRPENFRNSRWGGFNATGNLRHTGYPSDLVSHNGKWYLFMDGYCAEGKRHIGMAVSEQRATGPYTVIDEAVLSPDRGRAWDNQSCFYAKILPYHGAFLMFYDGKNQKGLERVGMAQSHDLLNWEKWKDNPVLSHHTGWRSKEGVTEPAFVMERNDSIFLLAAGAKRFKMGPWHHHVTRRMYMDKSGNVDFAALGFFVSADGGKSFVAHPHNPLFINNFSNPWEDSHLGSNFHYFKTDTAEIIIYQAKSGIENPQYNIMLRERKLKVQKR